MSLSILITGATGFVGSHILKRINSPAIKVIGRKKPEGLLGEFFKGDINPVDDYSIALKNVDVVIHSAARAHVMDDEAESPLEAYRYVNTSGTMNLARQAAKSGVSRFVFISSIKVNGEGTLSGEKFFHNDVASPEDDYGISKMEAEVALRKLSSETNMEVVIIRPPLVYGFGVKANFASMMNIARKNLPLPLGAIRNKRSLVAVDNLVDLIVICYRHPEAADKTFLVSDDHDVSTTELLAALTRAVGKKPCLIPVPMKLIEFLATLIGKKAISDRLCGNLQLDISYTKETLGWIPKVSFEDGIARCFTRADK